MMLRRCIVTAVFFLLFAGNASSVLADDEMAKAVKQTVETYCKIEYDGAWVEDRWAIVKLSPKREKAERIYRDITDTAVFGLQHYPFIVITSYDIREVSLLNPTHATAKVAYNRIAHSVSNTGKDWRHWHLVADQLDNDLVTLNLVYEKNKWWVLDPPPPRISKDRLIEYYEYEIKHLNVENDPRSIFQFRYEPEAATILVI